MSENLAVTMLTRSSDPRVYHEHLAKAKVLSVSGKGRKVRKEQRRFRFFFSRGEKFFAAAEKGKRIQAHLARVAEDQKAAAERQERIAKQQAEIEAIISAPALLDAIHEEASAIQAKKLEEAAQAKA